MLRAALMPVLAATLSLGLASAAEAWQPLLSPAEFEAVMATDAPILVDIRSVADYAKGHVEGAVNVPYLAWRGPESNPGALISEEKLTLILSELGVEPETPVVVTYRGADATDFGGAARVYWTLKSAGVREIAILNGGVAAWTEAGLPLTTVEASNMPSDLEFHFRPDWLATRYEVRDIVEGRAAAQLIDARPESFFEGHEKNELAAWAGTLAGALDLDYRGWFPASSALIADPETLRARVAAAGYKPGGPELVSFCNTGHWAATNWFVLSEIAGIPNVKLYPESMVGWTQAVSRVAQSE